MKLILVCKNLKVFTNFLRTTIDKYERNTVLTVRRATRADSGRYKLILKNGSGVCESVADVVVLGRYFIK